MLLVGWRGGGGKVVGVNACWLVPVVRAGAWCLDFEVWVLNQRAVRTNAPSSIRISVVWVECLREPGRSEPALKDNFQVEEQAPGTGFAGELAMLDVPGMLAHLALARGCSSGGPSFLQVERAAHRTEVAAAKHRALT